MRKQSYKIDTSTICTPIHPLALTKNNLQVSAYRILLCTDNVQYDVWDDTCTPLDLNPLEIKPIKPDQADQVGLCRGCGLVQTSQEKDVNACKHCLKRCEYAFSCHLHV